MNRNRRPATPIAPIAPAAPGCLHPACQAHNSHQTSQHAAGLTPQPPATPAPAAPRRRVRISKNWVIGILVFLLVGLAGSLNDRDNEIAGLKAKVSHSHTATKTDSTQHLEYVIKLCKAISAKGDYAQCVTETLAQH